MPETLRTALYTMTTVKNYDPSRINDDVEANVIRALYSRLVEVDPKSQIPKPSLATYKVQGKRVTFTLRESYTSKNKRITSKDVYFSFLRLISLGSGTHGNIQLFLCPKVKISRIEDECPAIKMLGNGIEFTLENDWYSQMFIPFLMSTDFSVIPYDSINWEKKGYPIEDYSNTSGRYSIKVDDEYGNWTLEANANHVDHNPKQAKTIQITSDWGPQTEHSFESKEIDLITTTDYASYNFLKPELAHDDIRIFKTEKICSLYLQFTKKGLARFNEKQRSFIASHFRDKTEDIPLFSQLKISKNLFPQLGELALDDSQLKLIDEKFRQTNETRDIKAIFSSGKFYFDQYSKTFSSSPYIEVISTDPDKSSPIADFHVLSRDSSFFENFSLVNYTINALGETMKKEESEKLMSIYLSEPDKKKRLAFLRSVHMEFLLQGVVFPIGFMPYAAIARKPWTPDFSPFAAGSPLWQVTTD